MMTRTWLVCASCATRDPDDRPHEALTASDAEARLFRLAHAGHAGVREVTVDG